MTVRHLTTLVLCCGIWASSVGAAEPAGRVAALEGTAQVTRGGQTQPLATGNPVYVGDKLKTASGSKLRLLMQDETVLTLSANAEMTLDEQDLAPDKSRSAVGLLGGTLRALVPDRYGTPGSKFEVATPTAIAGVLGTGFLVVYDRASGTTTVVGLYDTISVRGRGKHGGVVTVGPKTTTVVHRGRAPTSVVPIDPSRLDGLVQSTELRLGLLPAGTPTSGTTTGGLPPSAGGGPGSGGSGVAGPSGVVDQPIDALRKRKPGTSSPPPKPPPPPPGSVGAPPVGSNATQGGAGGPPPAGGTPALPNGPQLPGKPGSPNGPPPPGKP